MQAVLTVLGSGTSMGVPTIGCPCDVCRSTDPHDRRTRPSVMVEWGGHRVVIDTTPDFRQQALREKIDRVDAVLYTHGHADHILGLDDLRPLTYPRITGGLKVPLYANPDTARVLRSVFRYVFDQDYKFGGLAQVELHEITGPVQIFDAVFCPVTVIHGETPIFGYRFGSAAYLTDFSEVPESSRFPCWAGSKFFFSTPCATSRIPLTPRLRSRSPGRAAAAGKRFFYPHCARSSSPGDQCAASAQRAALP